MKSFFLIITALLLISCGKNGKNGSDGVDSSILGLDAVSTGVDFQDISPGLLCANGGLSVYTFRDSNADGLFDGGEPVIKVKSICNGINSVVNLESVTSSASCPNGGVKIQSSSSSPVEVCNGINGLNGEQGLQGVQGIPGLAGASGADGADGTQIKPVKFCEDDKSTHPEYGLMVGDELFAVYFGVTPASPKVAQAFLTKLVAGDYQSTGGNNCLFSVK